MRFLTAFGLGQNNKNRHRNHNRRLAKRRVLLEALEDRRLLAVFNVTTLVDEGFAGAGATATTEAADGNGLSLREAIGLANLNEGGGGQGELDGDSITFAAGLSAGTLSLTLGELSITDDLTIDGSAGVASSRITIDAGDNSRIFNVDTSVVAGANSNVALSELIVTNGDAGSGDGGGISEVNSPLTLTNVDITSSNALIGGGISGNGGSVTVTGGTMSGNTATSGGGITVLGDASLAISNSTIENNSAASDGGGIFVNVGSVATVDGGTISNNTASGALAGDGGGGIINFGGTLTIGNTSPVTISGNIADGAEGSGGGIFNGNGGTLTVNDTTISGNSAALEGGGLWNGTGTLSIDGTIIDGNTASGDAADDGGGGIFNNGGTVVLGLRPVPMISVTNNVANGTLGSGGGIFNNTGGTLDILGATITGNTAERAGGGIEDASGDTGSGVTVSDTAIDDNTARGTDAAPGNGGGVHVTGAGDVTISGGTVNGNSAALEGGGLWNGTGTMTIDDAIIDGNTASGDAADDGGGGIFNNGGTLEIGMVNAVRIASNVADGTLGSGGGIFNHTDGTLRIGVGTDIFANSAERAGGGIEDASGAATMVTLDGVALDNNTALGTDPTAPGNGGGLHISGDGIVEFFDGTVNDNTAAEEGGGLWNSGTGTLTIDGTTISGNTANSADAANDAQGGGGIFNNGGTLDIFSGVIDSNLALDPDLGVTQDDGGGGIFNNGGTVTIFDSDVTANDATDGLGNGGGILTLGGDVTVDGGFVDGNAAARAGGGIENNAGSVTLIDVVVEFNTAAINGGGLHVSGAGTTDVTDSLIDSNTAAEEGGGLWNSSSGTMMVDGAMISFNTASGGAADQGGGGIFNDGGTVRLMNGVTVDFNVADGPSGSGGGIFNNAGGTLTIDDSSVTSNLANRAGGGIEDNSGAGFGTTLTDVILENNEASGPGSVPGNGGGLHVTGAADVSITRGTVDSNSAAAEGGGLWNGSGTLTIDGTTISSNTASGVAADQGGGGVFNNGGTVNIRNADISSNTANGLAGSGGGILNDGGTLTVTGSFIDSNSAVRAGGGIEVTTANSRDSIAMLSNVTISGNTVGSSPGNGGGVHVSDPAGDNNTSTIQITGGSVQFNSAANEGGGLWNDAGGTMTIDGTTIDGNTAGGTSTGGGGIFNNGGTVNTQLASVTNNSADGLDGDGGGIFNDAGGRLSVTDSTISGNTAVNNGGGINNLAGFAVTNSTISGNSAVSGGGIYTNSPAGSSLINSTISVNSANEDGGGILNSEGTLTVIHSTIGANRSNADGDASGTGGGIWTFDNTATVTNLFNTIVAGNVTGADSADAPNDIAEKAIEPGSANNLIGDPASAGGLDEGTDGNRIGDGSGALLPLDQILDPTLADNGGPTLTHALVTNSRAVDGGDNSFSTTAGDDGLPGTGDTNEAPILGDQRGFPFQREFGASVDIGAFEQQTVDPDLLIVTTTDDSVAFDSEVSLREAIIAAETISGDNIVTFDSNVFATAQTILLSLGQLSSSDDNALTIDGPGRNLLTIDGQSNSRVLYFDGPGDLTVDGITITGGQTTQTGEGGDGAGILHKGRKLTVTDSEISGNTILGAGGFGGGLYSSGDMEVTGSTVSGNQADYFGGGLFADGEAMISESTITGNSARYSGGIDAGDLTISNSTISDNTATVDGGGIKAGGALSITGSTISENSAGNDGGGILATNATILNSTISGNTATQYGGGVHILMGGDASIVNSTITANDAFYGGGIYGDADITNLTIDNSIVAANTSAGTTPDVFAPATIQNSLIGNLEGTALTEAQPGAGPDANGNFAGDLNGGGLVDPMLGPLADDNGGPTATHALLAGSPAVDAGSNTLVPTGVDFDQRGPGFPRVVDGDLSGTATVDMGAFELSSVIQQDPVVTISPTGPNGAPDPDDLPSGPQPTSWAQQRSDLRAIMIDLGAPITSVSASDLVLTNLGLNGTDNPGEVITLRDNQLSLSTNGLQIQINLDANQLTDGIYQLDILTGITGGATFTFTGDATNKFYVLTGDWNGSGGVNIQDFATFAYWFGNFVPTAPDYVDVNDSGGINIQDFAGFAANFGKGIVFPGTAAPLNPLNTGGSGGSGGEGELASALRTLANPTDVNGDGSITARDALNVMNAIDRVDVEVGWSRFDANQDGKVSSADALYVINRLADGPLVSQIGSVLRNLNLDDESPAASADHWGPQLLTTLAGKISSIQSGADAIDAALLEGIDSVVSRHIAQESISLDEVSISLDEVIDLLSKYLPI